MRSWSVVNKRKIACYFYSSNPHQINCPNVKGLINSTFVSQPMDSDEKYRIYGYDYIIPYACSSLYLYINILLLVGIIFILF